MLIFGVVLMVAVPAGIVRGQSTSMNYSGRAIDGARIEPMLLRQCGPDVPVDTPCGPGIPNPHPINIPVLPNPVIPDSYQQA